jgi:lipid A ethanolaminephosphotransferase
MPYAFAPDAQTHIPAFAWIPPGSNFDFDYTITTQNLAFSHDDLYCTLLLAMDVKTAACEGKHTILAVAP